MNKKQIAITLGMMCLILTITLVVQVRTVNNANKITASTSLSDNDLRDQVLKWKERYDSTYIQLEEAEKKLEEVRQLASENTEGSKEKEEELIKNNMLIGLTDVQGEGVIVTLSDNNKINQDNLGLMYDLSYYLVHYGDLLAVINELKNAGAEAISINGQRLVSTSSITCEGNVINVNGEKISSPFEIKAICSPSYTYTALTRLGGTLEILNGYVIATVEQSKNIEIGKYTGVINTKSLKYEE